MNWDQIGAIGELVSGLAVLITLVYLAVQLKQAKHLMLSNAHQSRTDRNIALVHFLVNDDQSLRGFTGNLDFSDLDDLQKSRATLLFSATLRHFEDMHYQFELGVIDDDTWEANLVGIQGATASLAAKEMWKRCKHMFRKPFVDLVDSLSTGDE